MESPPYQERYSCPAWISRIFRIPINNILYGHHMDNYGMFGDVTEFLDQKYFDEHKTGSLLTKDFKKYDLEVFAVLQTDAMDPDVYSMCLVSDGNTRPLIDSLRERAKYFENLQKNHQKYFL